jgi:hypothetical protein
MTAVTQLPVMDALAASAHGLTEQGWYALTDQERADHRWTITHGNNYPTGNR